MDLAKAFDHVRHYVSCNILQHVGGGDVIRRGVKMAYKSCTTRLIIIRNLSDNIQILSSVRQGCPLSPLLFSLYLEPFCLSVQPSQFVNGFKLQFEEVKLLVYADGVAAFCTDLKVLFKSFR